MKTKLLLLCSLLIFFLLWGCKGDGVEPESLEGGIDGKTFFADMNQAPSNLVPKESLPSFLIDKIKIYEELFPDGCGFIATIRFYKGEWKNQTIYFIYSPLFSCIYCEVYYKDGSKCTTNKDEFADFQAASKNWVLIYEVTEESLRSPLTKSGIEYVRTVITDKFVFPIQPNTGGWAQYKTVFDRIVALQIPSTILMTISTQGLLETCLDYPYLINIHFYNNYQLGFEALLKEFNGFRELLRRTDLPDALIKKYVNMGLDLPDILMQSDVEKGSFSCRHFVLDYILAQDVVLNNLSVEQERALFFLSFEHTQIKSDNPYIFGNLSTIPTCLLYAKKMTRDIDAEVSGNMRQPLQDFIQAPRLVDRNIREYLEEYAKKKFK